jgi:hypothetical protein
VEGTPPGEGLPKVRGLPRPRLAVPRPKLQATKGTAALNPFGANKMMISKQASLSEAHRAIQLRKIASSPSLSAFYAQKELDKEAGLADRMLLGGATAANKAKNLAPKFMQDFLGRISGRAAKAAQPGLAKEVGDTAAGVAKAQAPKAVPSDVQADMVSRATAKRTAAMDRARRAGDLVDIHTPDGAALPAVSQQQAAVNRAATTGAGADVATQARADLRRDSAQRMLRGRAPADTPGMPNPRAATPPAGGAAATPPAGGAAATPPAGGAAATPGSGASPAPGSSTPAGTVGATPGGGESADNILDSAFTTVKKYALPVGIVGVGAYSGTRGWQQGLADRDAAMRQGFNPTTPY